MNITDTHENPALELKFINFTILSEWYCEKHSKKFSTGILNTLNHLSNAHSLAQLYTQRYIADMEQALKAALRLDSDTPTDEQPEASAVRKPYFFESLKSVIREVTDDSFTGQRAFEVYLASLTPELKMLVLELYIQKANMEFELYYFKLVQKALIRLQKGHVKTTSTKVWSIAANLQFFNQENTLLNVNPLNSFTIPTILNHYDFVMNVLSSKADSIRENPTMPVSIYTYNMGGAEDIDDVKDLGSPLTTYAIVGKYTGVCYYLFTKTPIVYGCTYRDMPVEVYSAFNIPINIGAISPKLINDANKTKGATIQYPELTTAPDFVMQQ